MGIEAAIAGGIASNVAGGLMGKEAADDQMDAANAARASALAQFAGIDVPTIEEQELAYDMLQNVGDLTPAQEQYAGDLISDLENLDPRLRQAQMQALEQIAGIAEAEGMTDADYAAMRELEREIEGQAQARDQAILQNMAQRGVAGSGAELAARLQGAQAATDRMSARGDNMLQAALQRQMQAAQQQAQLGGQMRSQDVSQAQAMDAIKRFNLQNRQNLQQRAVDRENVARQQNLQERQRIADKNVAMRNLQQEANKGLRQQQFSNELALAQGRAGQYSQAADAATRRAGQEASMWSGIGQGVGDTLSSGFQYMSQQDKKKKGG